MRSEEQIARDALNARMRADRAQQGLTLAEQHVDRIVLYHAAVHALLFRAQFAGVSHEQLVAQLEGITEASRAALMVSDKLKTVLQLQLGLKRLEEAQRKRVNATLARSLYPILNDVQVEVALSLLIRFVKRHAAGIGLPLEVVMQRIGNLDALQRFAGPAQRYVPKEQYGL